MAQELIASGFGEAWDGKYIMQYDEMNSNNDFWKHEAGEYYILRNSWYWTISYSAYFLADSNLKAVKIYTAGSSPSGHYTGFDGKPDGDVAWESFP